MDDQVKQFRAAVQKLGGPGRGRRYPQALRDLAVSYRAETQAAGRSLRAAAADLGIAEATLDRWVSSAGQEGWQGGLQEVVLADSVSSSPLSVVTPGGYRVEGLSLPEITTLLRSLR